jgi:hypothetical protein
MLVRLGDNGDTKGDDRGTTQGGQADALPGGGDAPCVRWYVAYPLSLRHIEEMMAERGMFVDHATVHRCAVKIVPVLVKVFRGRKHAVGKSWRMDGTYIKVRGEWKYLRDVTILRSLPGIGRINLATLLSEASGPLSRRD